MFWPVGHVTLRVPRNDSMNRKSFRFACINSLKIFASTVREMEILINLSNRVYSRLSAFFGPVCGHYKIYITELQIEILKG